jgi:parvulin-like peptidyl-prolyl isomerase
MVSPQTQGLPDFIKAALSKMKVGEVSAPLTSTFGQPPKSVFVILKLVAKSESTVPPLDQIRNKVTEEALLAKNNGGQAKLEELIKDAVIDIKMPRYKNIFKTK